MPLEKDELARVAEVDMRTKGDFRGKTLLCASMECPLRDAQSAVERFAERGFFPSAQGFLAAVLGGADSSKASLPLLTPGGSKVVWSMRFICGGVSTGEPDSRALDILSPDTAPAYLRETVLKMYGFKLEQ